jgi:uncharacterized protein (TIGR03086 family)
MSDAMVLAAAARWNGLVDSIGDGQWTNATPCAGWDVTDLVVHVIERDRLLVAQLNGEPRDAERFRRAMDAERVTLTPDEDLVKCWHEQWAWWQAQLDDPRVRGVVRPTPFGQLDLPAVADRVNTMELAIHAWDLARGLGVDDSLDPDLVASCLSRAESLDRERLPPGLFADRDDLAGDAAPQDRLLGLLGRRPG